MSRSRPSCYVASPYGFAESTCTWYTNTFLPVLAPHVRVVDPWAVPVDHIDAMDQVDRPEAWVRHGLLHLNTIKSGIDLVVAALDQEPPDAGTLIELATASCLGIPVIGYRNDIRTTGEEGLRFNLMVHAAIRASGGTEVSSLVGLEQAVALHAAKISANRGGL